MIRSEWPAHGGVGTPGVLLDARRCTVQLSNGRLYLDAAATPATALLGHDLPSFPAATADAVRQMLSSLAPGYARVALARSSSAAAELAVSLGQAVLGTCGGVVEHNALDGQAVSGSSGGGPVVVLEDETLGRGGRWLSSLAWERPPDLIVIGEALALGSPFAAVLARHELAANQDLATRISAMAVDGPSTATLARVAAAITTVENEGLLQQGSEVASYLLARLLSIAGGCPEIESVTGTGLFFRVALAPPLAATQVCRSMCERGVLAAVDEAGRLVINPPLPLRIAEADVITGALRGAILGLPLATAAVCCAACEQDH